MIGILLVMLAFRFRRFRSWEHLHDSHGTTPRA
jgi:hypothetical protein